MPQRIDPDTTQERPLLSFREVMALQARVRREKTDVREIMGDLRATMVSSEAGALMRLFRGYAD